MQIRQSLKTKKTPSFETFEITSLPQCCEQKPNILRVYDNGDGTTEAILICSEHSDDQAFQEGVLKEEILK